jgi:hypothetical protein
MKNISGLPGSVRPNWDDAPFKKIAEYRALEALPSVRELDQRWRIYKGGIQEAAKTISFVGIFAIIFRGEIVAIGSGSNAGRGIGTRLLQIMQKTSTGNSHLSAAMIKQHIDEVEIAAINFTEWKFHRDRIVKYANKFKSAYKPGWNAKQQVPLAK